DDLSVSYNGNKAIKDISFSFETGNLIGIIGPNGAGKSTLMKAMLGLIPKDSGAISMNGQTIKQVRKNIAYVPQRNNIDWDFPILVRDTVLLGTYPKLGLFKRPTAKEKEKADECLARVGMQDFAKRQISELSGGQQQRVFLARALAQEADFFFMDEPFVGIDVASEEVMSKHLRKLRDEGKTIFLVHHDLSKVEDYFNKLVLINKAVIQTGPVIEVVKPEIMKEAYNLNFNTLQGIGVGVYWNLIVSLCIMDFYMRQSFLL